MIYTKKILLLVAAFFISLSSYADTNRVEKNEFNTGRNLRHDYVGTYPVTTYESLLGKQFINALEKTNKDRRVFDAGAGSALAWWDFFIEKKGNFPRSTPFNQLTLFLYNLKDVNTNHIKEMLEIEKITETDLERILKNGGGVQTKLVLGDFAETGKKDMLNSYDLGTDNNGAFSYSNTPDIILENELNLLKANGRLFLTYDERMYTWTEVIPGSNPIKYRPLEEPREFGPNFRVLNEAKFFEIIKRYYTEDVAKRKSFRKEVLRKDILDKKTSIHKMLIEDFGKPYSWFKEEERVDRTEQWFASIIGATCHVTEPDRAAFYRQYDLDALTDNKLKDLSGTKKIKIVKTRYHKFVKTEKEEINLWNNVECVRNGTDPVIVPKITPLVIGEGRPNMRIYLTDI